MSSSSIPDQSDPQKATSHITFLWIMMEIPSQIYDFSLRLLTFIEDP